MKKIYLLTFFVSLIFLSCGNTHPGSITGLWQCSESNSKPPQGLVVIYRYHGRYYGRMLATYDNKGRIKDSILEKNEKAPGVIGNPPYCGMDFIYNLHRHGTKKGGNPVFIGKILNPEKGKVYTVKVWRENNDLVVRGELFFMGKNIYWTPATNSDLPKGFSISEIKNFKPVIPKAK